MSVIAVFIALGGTSYAISKLPKNSVGTKQLKSNSVTSAKLKNGAVTGAKLNLASLGTVPSATSADHAISADNATTASNANTVNGQTATRVFAKLAPGQTNVQIVSFAGFSISATCTESGDVDNLLVHPPAGVADDMKAQGNGDAGVTQYHTQSAGDSPLPLDETFGGTNNSRGETTFSGATTTGSIVSGMIGFEDANSFVDEEACAVYGEVFSG